jgi:hypothetical protein
MPSYIDIQAAIEAAKKLLVQHKKTQREIAIVRTDLRNAVELGGGTPDQRKWIADTFPVAKRTRKTKAGASS